jgi:sulfite exporter TauE/SafE
VIVAVVIVVIVAVVIVMSFFVAFIAISGGFGGCLGFCFPFVSHSWQRRRAKHKQQSKTPANPIFLHNLDHVVTSSFVNRVLV